MPCWTVRRISVEFKVGNRTLLESVLAGRCYYWRGNTIVLDTGIELDLDSGMARFQPWRQAEVNQLKQAYSLAAIKQASKTVKGWKLKVTGNKAKLARRVLR
jgi:hypothetical protein